VKFALTLGLRYGPTAAGMRPGLSALSARVVSARAEYNSH
jgi:hypothetical protein